MKLYMYSQEEAKKNHCKYDVNPVGKFLVFLVLFIIFLFLAIFLSTSISGETIISKLLSLIPWIVLCIFSIVYFKYFLKNLRLKNWAAQIAFIKEGDTLWAVKLTYLHFPVFTINDNLVTTVLSIPAAINSAETNQRLKKEMEERKIYPESFQEALLDAKKEKNIMKDLDDNFTFIFNGRASVIRLDDIKYVSETDTTEIYTYKNYKGKTTTFEIIKAYPGLREEIKNTATVSHEFPFPKKYKEKINSNPWYVFLILMGLFIGIPILIILVLFFIS